MYNLTVRGHDISGNHSFTALPEKIKAVGIGNVQLALGMSFPELPSGKENISPGFGTFMKNTFMKQDVQIAILSCYINMIHPNEEIREEVLQKFESYLKYAKYFGASMVASETGNVLEEIIYTEKNFTEAAFEKAVVSIQRLVNCGEKYGMMVGIEPGLNHPIYSVEKMHDLVQRIDSDYLGVILDATNLITADNYQKQTEILQQAFDLFGEKIVAIHLKDFIIEDEKVVPTAVGEGLMDVQGMLEIINKNKPLINIVLEETKDEKIAQAKKLIASL
ncbi:sugar phosphate isomerase/epimerase family protein [Enterococcus sp. BWR-S5]|uniref:sugar phosphate isomerase/epimerase family protein n=1 Tax=Enterococcus sp. BWR-S5 TaxID=2787714 RepID=UPI0019225604|nr:sugar phosphate isomerase/epimerase [Enterococcus sp. BWR-S5]MBL1225125.1 sugar phosphate isomerase/epimerase [Enterococcus sp. BWR-S5]